MITISSRIFIIILISLVVVGVLVATWIHTLNDDINDLFEEKEKLIKRNADLYKQLWQQREEYICALEELKNKEVEDVK